MGELVSLSSPEPSQNPPHLPSLSPLKSPQPSSPPSSPSHSPLDLLKISDGTRSLRLMPSSSGSVSDPNYDLSRRTSSWVPSVDCPPNSPSLVVTSHQSPSPSRVVAPDVNHPRGGHSVSSHSHSHSWGSGEDSSHSCSWRPPPSPWGPPPGENLDPHPLDVVTLTSGLLDLAASGGWIVHTRVIQHETLLDLSAPKTTPLLLARMCSSLGLGGSSLSLGLHMGDLPGDTQHGAGRLDGGAVEALSAVNTHRLVGQTLRLEGRLHRGDGDTEL